MVGAKYGAGAITNARSVFHIKNIHNFMCTHKQKMRENMERNGDKRETHFQWESIQDKVEKYTSGLPHLYQEKIQ